MPPVERELAQLRSAGDHLPVQIPVSINGRAARRLPGVSCATLRRQGRPRNASRAQCVSSSVRIGVVVLLSLLAVAGCTANGPLAPNSSPAATRLGSPSPSPSPSAEETPSPTAPPSPTVQPTPVSVPSWAALHASCAGQPAAQEAVLQLQGATNAVLADVSNPKAPRTLCGISGGAFQPQLVTQTMISWHATQGSPTAGGTSVIAVLDLFTGTSTIAASWSGGSFMDGLHAWSPDRGFLAYIAFTVRDKTGTPHVWLYGHGGHSGGQLPNVRSSPAWLNSTTFFYVEETVCSTNCALGPAWGPDGKTFTFDLAQQTETSSKINQVYGVWPRAGQL